MEQILQEKKIEPELIFAIAKIPALKCEQRLKLISLIDSVERLAEFSKEDLFMMIQKIPKARKQWEVSSIIEEGQKDFLALTRLNVDFTWFGDSHYPSLLRELFDPPFLLFYRGNYDALANAKNDCVGMVGTRRPPQWAVDWSLENAAVFANNGVPVVSGLAYGIDAASHRGALLASGTTIAVLPSGVGHIYPRGNVRLAEKILETGGLLLSEYSPYAQPREWQFVQRNRIISGLSRAVLVVSAPEKSGALITSDFAIQQNREVFVPKENLGTWGTEGTQKLVDDGATAIESCREILEIWKENPNWSSVAGC